MRRFLFIMLAVLAAVSAMAEDRNVTASPDGLMEAFTRDNDLWVREIGSGRETRLTYDGSDVILNGYASWVYYEEILGRAGRYRAFWWSPDSRKLGFFRFDNSQVPVFPIYSPDGQDGNLSLTRYPKAGETNPEVRVGIVGIEGGETVWADFERSSEQYFGTPFWGPDSREFFVVREPRRQDRYDMYAVSASDGTLRHVHHVEYPEGWVDLPEEVLFSEKGLYVADSHLSGWEQIYFIPYDGSGSRCLTSGNNWNIHLIRADERKGDVWFTANRDSDVRRCFYKVDRKGAVTLLTDPAMNVHSIEFDDDGKGFSAALSNFGTPPQLWHHSGKGRTLVAIEADASDFAGAALPQIVYLDIEGLEVPAEVWFPAGFDPSRKYPVHIEIYGGPGTEYVRERWIAPNEENQWWSRNGIIHVVADCRASGHNGRKGVDMSFKDVTTVPVGDFCRWAEYFGSLPYVDASRIGVEGFSFGGTMTTMLLLAHSDLFCCGMAGGGVADWSLYDSIYTERFMLRPVDNPDGYARASALRMADPAISGDGYNGHLMITHGTADDNVHFQNTLQLIDALQKNGRFFELMIYPDGKHGYRGAQHIHDLMISRAFWTKYLLK